MPEVPAVIRALLLALGSLAVVGALMLEIHRRAELNRERGRQAAQRTDAELFVASLRAQLQTPESCTSLLGAQALRARVLNWTFAPSHPGPLEAGAEVALGLRLEAVALKPGPTPDMETKLRDSDGQWLAFSRYPSHLHVRLAGQDHHLPVLVWVDGDERISACFTAQSAGAACNAVGGYYVADPADPMPLELRCRQSMHTRAAVDGRMENRGSCRLAGLARDGCERLGAVRVQDAFRSAASGFLCLLCE